MDPDRRNLVIGAGALALAAGCGTVARRVAGRKVPEDAAVPPRTG